MHTRSLVRVFASCLNIPLTVKLLIEGHLRCLSLKGGCKGWCESTPVKIPICWKSNGPRREKTCLRRFVNNTGADQPAHPCSLISAFVIRYLESVIYKLAIGEI